jgi:hypothetical protein
MQLDAPSVVTKPKAAARLLVSGPSRVRKGFERVASYRLYGLDGVRKVASAEWIEADDDRAAIAAATERFGDERCEVWQGARRVARLGVEDEPVSPRPAGAGSA